ETIAHVADRVAAGNVYVNRNLIGAVVGVQPFGGHGLSGTGPKAGGPLYLRRLLARCPPWSGAVGATLDLPGPVGERNVYRLEPRGTVLCIAPNEAALSRQMRAVLATGNRVLVDADRSTASFDAVLFEGDADTLRALNRQLAARDGPIVPAYLGLPLEWLVRERSISTNTAAAGGNATLMSIG
ncbi:MAG TPA: aldehyde dehydrogenase family protein, partial [Acetobacteraceae bacterium]